MKLNKLEPGKALHSEASQAGLSSSSPQQTASNSPVSPREGESATQARFRANRLFSSGSAWYFSTREGQEHGPFLNREQAEKAVYEFIKSVAI